MQLEIEADGGEILKKQGPPKVAVPTMRMMVMIILLFMKKN